MNSSHTTSDNNDESPALFKLPPSVRLETGPGGLAVLRVNAPGGTGEIFVDGAHVTSWIPTGQLPVLWMSDTSRFISGSPIRGGIPICFPWFGKYASYPERPQHGFARISAWELIDVHESGTSVTIVLRLTDSEISRRSSWPHRFEATYTVSLGTELELTLDVVNRDKSAITFEEALHTYYAVGDVHKTRIDGLENLNYHDGDTSFPRQNAQPLRIGSGIS
jgi:glucose-6-phosphate 1-epimerase